MAAFENRKPRLHGVYTFILTDRESSPQVTQSFW